MCATRQSVVRRSVHRRSVSAGVVKYSSNCSNRFHPRNCYAALQEDSVQYRSPEARMSISKQNISARPAAAAVLSARRHKKLSRRLCLLAPKRADGTRRGPVRADRPTDRALRKSGGKPSPSLSTTVVYYFASGRGAK